MPVTKFPVFFQELGNHEEASFSGVMDTLQEQKTHAWTLRNPRISIAHTTHIQISVTDNSTQEAWQGKTFLC